MFEPSLVYQHLVIGTPRSPVTVQPWQVINLVGGPLAAILLLPPIIDDLERWWRARAEERNDVKTSRPRDS